MNNQIIEEFTIQETYSELTKICEQKLIDKCDNKKNGAVIKGKWMCVCDSNECPCTKELPDFNGNREAVFGMVDAKEREKFYQGNSVTRIRLYCQRIPGVSCFDCALCQYQNQLYK